MLANDVLGEAGALLRSGPSTQRLTNWHDVVIDGLRQANDGQAVIILSQVGGQIGGGGVGVVATEGVLKMNPVGSAASARAGARGPLGGGGGGVVATEGVQTINPVGNQAIGGDLERIIALGDQTTLYEVGGVGQLDAGVANRGSTKALENVGILANGVGNFEEVRREQALIAVLVGDDLNLRCYLGVALDQSTDRGRQARRKSARGEK